MPETYTPEQDAYILKHAGKKKFKDIGEILGINRHQVRGRLLRLQEAAINSKIQASQEPQEPECKVEVSVKGDFQTIVSDDVNIRTLEQLLEHCEVDLSVWEVDSHSVTSYQSFAKTQSIKISKKEWRKQLTRVPLFRVKCTLKRISSAKKATEELRKTIIAEMDRHSPKTYKSVPRSINTDNPVMVEINIADHHFAKLCWAPEVGSSYDLKIAERMFDDAIDDFYGQIKGMEVEKILLPLGNDFFHTDNDKNMTANGTPQDVDDRWQKMFMIGKRCLIRSIDKLRQLAPVDIVVVPGNHDRTRCFYIGDTLQSWYRNDPEVKVDNTPPKRKYVEYGTVLLGFTHLDTESDKDLPMQMAITQKQAFARTTHWEWHCGHLHTRRHKELKPLDIKDGVHFRILPSLCAPDAWHYDNCYNLSPRASEAFIWRKKTGYGGILVHNPKL